MVLSALAAYHFGAVPGGRRVCLVVVDGRPVTVVATRGEAQRLLEEVKRAAGPAERVEFAQEVTFRTAPAAGNPVQNEKKALEALSRTLRPVIEGAAIIVNGEVVVGLPSKAEATKVLSLLQREFAPEGTGFTIAFKEEVKVRTRRVARDRFVESPEAAIEKIRGEMAPTTIHKVQPGETAWEIAREAHVPLSRLAHANPGLDIAKLRVGDQVKIPGMSAPITVVARKEIRQPVGEEAERRLQVVRLTYENGALVSREVIGYRPLPGRRPRAERAGPPPEERPQPREEE